MPSVLIVDDEEQIRKLLRTTLERAGYEVVEGSTGKEAILQYRIHQTDLVIMDILMPEKDGLESILELRQEFPEAKVIAITGVNDKIGILNFLEVARMLGAKRTFRKPFELDELLNAVTEEIYQTDRP